MDPVHSTAVEVVEDGPASEAPPPVDGDVETPSLAPLAEVGTAFDEAPPTALATHTDDGSRVVVDDFNSSAVLAAGGPQGREADRAPVEDATHPSSSSSPNDRVDGSPLAASPIALSCCPLGDATILDTTAIFPSMDDDAAQPSQQPQDAPPAYATHFRARAAADDCNGQSTPTRQCTEGGPYASAASRVFHQLAAPSFAHVTSLLLSGCGLHDEDLAQVFHRPDYYHRTAETSSPNSSATSTAAHAAPLLPCLYHLDLSENLLQTFPTFILGRFDVHATAAATPASAVVVQRSRPASPWIVSVANNKRMRMFPPLVLECDMIGSVSVDGCDALMPNVVVAGFKGLVCGAVQIPQHTDETAVYENMLGLLAINGCILSRDRRSVAPQHARKCEAHLQTLRRRYNTSHPPSPWFVVRLLSCLKLDVDTRHVAHPRLVEKHHKQVTAAAEVYVLDLLGSAFASRLGSTGRFAVDVAPHDDDAVGGAVECMRYGTQVDLLTQCPDASRRDTTPPTATGVQQQHSATSQGPLYFNHWVVAVQAAATDDRLRRMDVAVCALVAHAYFPEVCSRNAMLAVVDRVLEACAMALAHEDDTTSAVKAAILALLDVVELWPTFAFQMFAEHVARALGVSTRSSNSTEGEGSSMQSRVSPERSPPPRGATAADGRLWMTRVPDAPTALPLSLLLAEVQECRCPSSSNPSLLGGCSRPLDTDQSVEKLETLVAQAAQTEQLLHASAIEDSVRREAAAVVSLEARRSRAELMMRPSSFNHPRRRMDQQSPATAVAAPSYIPGHSVGSSLGGMDDACGLYSDRTHSEAESVAEAEALAVAPLHTGFLPVRQASGEPRGRGGGLAHAGAYHLVNGRDAMSASLARRPPSRQAPQPSPARHQQAQLNTSCLRLPAEAVQRSQPLSTSAKDAHTAFHHLNTTAPTTIGSNASVPLSEASPSERHRSAPRGGLRFASDAAHCTSLVQFLRRRGQLHLQSASKAKSIADATAIDLAPLRPPSALVEGYHAAVHGSASPTSLPTPTLSSTVRPQVPNVDPASFGCTLDEYGKAANMYPAMPTHSSTQSEQWYLSVDAVLLMLYKLMAPQERLVAGAVYRAFTAWLCVTCVEHRVNNVASLPPDAACDLVCVCLHHRGALHLDCDVIVDEIMTAHGLQPHTRGGGSDRVLGPAGGGDGALPTNVFISEIHGDALSDERARGAMSNAAAGGWGNTHHANPSAAVTTISEHHHRPPSQASCAVRRAVSMDHELSTLATASHRVGLSSNSPTTARPSSVLLADRGSHPFLVQAQATLERERIRGHIRAASATPEDPLTAQAVKRSCSASLRPLRRTQPTASGRTPTDWVATNHQFIPLLVRQHLSASANAKGAYPANS